MESINNGEMCDVNSLHVVFIGLNRLVRASAEILFFVLFSCFLALVSLHEITGFFYLQITQNIHFTLHTSTLKHFFLFMPHDFRLFLPHKIIMIFIFENILLSGALRANLNVKKNTFLVHVT